jgi:nanoRNase/pAp phosphatase (c-di-AMP/oligoRNAs hydrolase)
MAQGETRFRQLERLLAGRPAGPVLVLSHQSPDPDALGAVVGMRFLLKEGLGRDAVIATRGRIQRAENVAMARELGLYFADQDTLDRSGFAGSVLVDSQPGFGHTAVPHDLPLLAVVDHHEPAEGPPAMDVLHEDIRPGVGATSSLVFEYIRDAGLRLDPHTATSLFCGIRFDTTDLAHDVTPLDEEAYYATLRMADKGQLARIKNPKLPPDYYRELARTLRRAKRHGSLVLALLGPISSPEIVAEMADFFLRMENCHWSVVGGAHEGTFHISVRTQFRPAFPVLDLLLQGEGSFGGHGRIAGGQVPLDPSGTGAGGDDARRRLERRIRARALHILESVDGSGRDAQEGRPVA